jgi:hypothetical protein
MKDTLSIKKADSLLIIIVSVSFILFICGGTSSIIFNVNAQSSANGGNANGGAVSGSGSANGGNANGGNVTGGGNATSNEGANSTSNSASHSPIVSSPFH